LARPHQSLGVLTQKPSQVKPMYAANKTSIGNKVDRGTDPMSYRNNLKDY